MIERVRAGKTPAQLSREFECSAQTLINGVAQAALDEDQPVPSKQGQQQVDEGILEVRQHPAPGSSWRRGAQLLGPFAESRRDASCEVSPFSRSAPTAPATPCTVMRQVRSQAIARD